MYSCFHPFSGHLLTSDIEASLPPMLSFPLPLQAHPLCEWAAEQVKNDVESNPLWQQEMAKGKMMGVVVVRLCAGDEVGRLGYLRAYSGQIGGRSDWEGYVPAVFDYLQPDGYFKIKEAEIDILNSQIADYEQSVVMKQAISNLVSFDKETEKMLQEMKDMMAEHKIVRDNLRRLRPQDLALMRELERESQFQKAELRRLKARRQLQREPLQQAVDSHYAHIQMMKQRRRQQSDSLQQWLFRQFKMRNYLGEQLDLIEIFKSSTGQLPPAGTGECCAPKLLHYAFTHSMQPLALSEFWFGHSPSGEIRKHGAFYQPCKSKCQPLLSWMLPHDSVGNQEYSALRDMKIVYKDRDIIVVDKPAGMISVAGKTGEMSVEKRLSQMFPADNSLMMVHRLDMDTSGLMVVARTKSTHKELQRQFEHHQVWKRYVALVDGKTAKSGEITLPLRPDFDDRPRQMVDPVHGLPATTRYEKLSEQTIDGQEFTRLYLYPSTGRTHQLRVHCAHSGGLNAPIRGDRLYGKPADRLYLQADRLRFKHPTTDEIITFQIENEF